LHHVNVRLGFDGVVQFDTVFWLNHIMNKYFFLDTFQLFLVYVCNFHDFAREYFGWYLLLDLCRQPRFANNTVLPFTESFIQENQVSFNLADLGLSGLHLLSILCLCFCVLTILLHYE
jgi:hypothetical protein